MFDDLVRRLRRNPEPFIAALALAAFFCTGLAVHGDYGVSWDEPNSRYKAGQVPWQYVSDVWSTGSVKPYPMDYPYGFLYSLVAVAVEQVTGRTDVYEVYQQRHLVAFVFFFAGVVAFYFLARRLFADRYAALLAVFGLILSPRLFAHGFYNPKDTPLMALCIVAMLTLVRVLERPSVGRVVVHGAACAAAIAMRLPGLFLLAVTGIMFLLCLAQAPREARMGWIRGGVIYGVSAIAFVVLLWPLLWHDPLVLLVDAFGQLSAFPSRETVLFLGEYVARSEVPWYYLFTGMELSSPELFVLFGPVGIVSALLAATGRQTSLGWSRQSAILALIWFFLPLAIIIGRGSTLYDGWRHVQFVYPALILLVVGGTLTVWHWLHTRLQAESLRPARRLLLAAWVVQFALVLRFMVAAHPHQGVYFNQFIGGPRGAVGLFDLDYWGPSYRQALEWIADHDSSDTIFVAVANEAGQNNLDIMHPRLRSRIRSADSLAGADYFLSNFKHAEAGYPMPLHAVIEVDGAPIVGIYKLKPSGARPSKP